MIPALETRPSWLRTAVPSLGLAFGLLGCPAGGHRTDTQPAEVQTADAKMPGVTTDEHETHETTPAEPIALTPETERVVADSINAFAVDLHRALATGPGNVFVSPASIAIAFAMTHVGARGATAEELARTFHVGDPVTTQQGFAGVLARWNAATGGLELDVANRLFGEATVPFEPAFVTTTKVVFGAPLEPLDFKRASEAARVHINGWVAAQTHDKILDLLPPGGVDPGTRLVLVNAVYFKAKWEEPFNEWSTQDAPFHGTGGTTTVKLMAQVGHYRLGAAPEGKARVLELPYEGGAYSMVVVLPEAKDGLPALEQAITAESLSRWIADATVERVQLKLPRFEIRPEALRLRATLERLGLVTAFDPSRADFTGIAPRKEQLVISEAFHKAFVAVDEVGTEAAAATAIAARAGSAPPSEPPVPFVADHPFLFLVRDTESGAILFLGRLAEP